MVWLNPLTLVPVQLIAQQAAISPSDRTAIGQSVPNPSRWQYSPNTTDRNEMTSMLVSQSAQPTTIPAVSPYARRARA